MATASVAVLALAPSATAATKPTTASVVSSTQNAKLGPILVAGTTVYTLAPNKTACNVECAKDWPPVLLPHGVKTATAGPNVDASKLGTAKSGKNLQVTYAGKRLYWSAKDTKAGQVHGNVHTKWGRWSTVAAASGATSTTVAPTTEPTTAPTTEVPTAPPATAPATAPPETAPPETSPPATPPPTTRPPSPPPTTSAGNGGVGF
jgi:predicted lipoprotein with Yx(FWY)xxD motif